MSLRRFPPTNRNVEAISSVTTAPTHNLSGLDSVGPPEYSLTDTLGAAEASQVVTPNYSKRPYGNINSTHLCEFC
jgi:hypothetical protein